VSRATLRWLLSFVPRLDAGGGTRLTIVRHHRVYGDGERPLYRLGVSESVLDAQLALLRRLDRTPVTVAEGLEHLVSGRPGQRVAMSFDDGYADNVTRALPLLRRHGARATFYLTSGWIEERRVPWWDVLAHALEHGQTGRAIPDFGGTGGTTLDGAGQRVAVLTALLPAFRAPLSERDRRLAELRRALGVESEAVTELATWDQARALVEGGMEVGAHTMNHPHLSLLDRAAQQREIADSARLIEQRLGVRPAGLAYPGGDYDESSPAAVAASGLNYAVTTRSGDNVAGAPRFELRRRGWSEGACIGPTGRFSERLATAELNGAFDHLRAAATGAGV
jgi:peptidoglycan/xylan/chitin deacetylase (PgdA/CDA1 family)